MSDVHKSLWFDDVADKQPREGRGRACRGNLRPVAQLPQAFSFRIRAHGPEFFFCHLLLLAFCLLFHFLPLLVSCSYHIAPTGIRQLFILFSSSLFWALPWCLNYCLPVHIDNPHRLSGPDPREGPQQSGRRAPLGPCPRIPLPPPKLGSLETGWPNTGQNTQASVVWYTHAIVCATYYRCLCRTRHISP
jgi:hypothetical protein